SSRMASPALSNTSSGLVSLAISRYLSSQQASKMIRNVALPSIICKFVRKLGAAIKVTTGVDHRDDEYDVYMELKDIWERIPYLFVGNAASYILGLKFFWESLAIYRMREV